MDVNFRRYDLHSHTIASDGELTPTELLNHAIKNQIDVLAITDHDSINSLAEAHDVILQKKLPLKLINGIEISTAWYGHDIHIVGLNIDIENKELLLFIEKQKKYRITRAKEISSKLAQLGIMDAYEHTKKNYAKSDIVSRAHFAHYMADKGIVNDVAHAFQYYLSKGKKAYIEPKWCSIAEAITIIHSAGGRAVLAHPMRYNLTQAKLTELFCEFKQANGDAIEVLQNRQTEHTRRLLEKYALQYDFLGSQGSDFHRFNNPIGLSHSRPFSDNVTPIWHDWPHYEVG